MDQLIFTALFYINPQLFCKPVLNQKILLTIHRYHTKISLLKNHKKTSFAGVLLYLISTIQ